MTQLTKQHLQKNLKKIHPPCNHKKNYKFTSDNIPRISFSIIKPSVDYKIFCSSLTCILPPLTLPPLIISSIVPFLARSLPDKPNLPHRFTPPFSLTNHVAVAKRFAFHGAAGNNRVAFLCCLQTVSAAGGLRLRCAGKKSDRGMKGAWGSIEGRLRVEHYV